MVLFQHRIMDQWNRMENPEIDLTYNGKGSLKNNESRVVYSISCSGFIRY